MDSLIKIAKDVILEESKALELLSQNIPINFEDAINLIYECKGRLVVSGIGKSGHIGRKISSTMSSLGQKSFFMHPSEAHHGDLGMLDQNDILLLISNSGETNELLPVIDFAKRFGIKIISITKNKESSLARNSDITLCLPSTKEACLLGLAPTVSSTLTLALGDSISVALLSKRGFTKEQFKILHPGGNLGRSISFAFDIMNTTNIPLVNDTDSMKESIIIISKFGLGCVGVVDKSQKLVGIITDGDLRRCMSSDLLQKSSSEIMTKKPITIDKNIPTSELLYIMENKKITNIFVVDKNQMPIGVIHMHDIITKKIV